jgi:hypothetical protein
MGILSRRVTRFLAHPRREAPTGMACSPVFRGACGGVIEVLVTVGGPVNLGEADHGARL